MSYEFTENNFGKSYVILEAIYAQTIANQIAVNLLVKENPFVASRLLKASENAEGVLLGMAILDSTITLVQSNLKNLSNL